VEFLDQLGEMMKLNERLASLEATVRLGFETAARDRGEVKMALDRANGKMDTTLGAIGLRLDMHDQLINQGKGFQKALTGVWAFMLIAWGIIEGIFHLGRGK